MARILDWTEHANVKTTIIWCFHSLLFSVDGIIQQEVQSSMPIDLEYLGI